MRTEKRVKVYDDGRVSVRANAVEARGRLLRAWKAWAAVHALKTALKAADVTYANALAALRGPEVAALTRLATLAVQAPKDGAGVSPV